MGAWKRVLISSVLIVWIVSGSWANPVQNAGSVSRSAKVLEDPKVPHDAVSSENTDLQDSSERSLSVEQNMMLYRTVFTLSLKLLTVFVLVRLLTYGLTSAGILKLGGPNSPFSHAELYYPVDVHQNPAAGWTQQIQQQQPTVVAGGGDAGGVGAVDPSGGVIVTSGVIPATVGGYDIAATNAKPSFLVPTGPRYRFGLRPWGRNPATRPRHPPMMRPHHPGMMPMIHSAQNMGEETHLVETHSHLFVHPDGTQMRVPIAGQKPVVSVVTSSSGSSNAAASSPTAQVTKSSTSTTKSPPVESSTSSPPAAAERRSSVVSTVFKDKKKYDDWNLHFNPGSRSL